MSVETNILDDVEAKILDDVTIDALPLKDLRTAYRELREVCAELIKRHHGRISDALAVRKEQGKKTGGDVPYGYRLSSDNETLIEDEAEQAVIAEAVRLREQGFSLRRIARELWKQRLRPRLIPGQKRRDLKTRHPEEFDPTQIRRMIAMYKTRGARAD